MENEVTEIYQAEIARMEKMGYTQKQIEREFDRMLNVQNMVALAIL